LCRVIGSQHSTSGALYGLVDFLQTQAASRSPVGLASTVLHVLDVLQPPSTKVIILMSGTAALSAGSAIGLLKKAKTAQSKVETAKGYATHHEYDNKALAAAKLASKPLKFTGICMAMMWACTIPLFLSGIPGMIAFFYTTLPLLWLYVNFYCKMPSFAERWNTKWEGQSFKSTMEEDSFASGILKMTLVFYGCQLLAGFSMISWVLYSGTLWSDCRPAYGF
jgi:hypothetical protein